MKISFISISFFLLLKLKKLNSYSDSICKGHLYKRMDVMVNTVRSGHRDSSSNTGEGCISHSTNTLEEDINPTILPSAMDE